MKKSEIIMELKKQGVVAVIRGNSLEEGIGISKACIAGGLTAIEMAYTNANASEIIEEMFVHSAGLRLKGSFFKLQDNLYF